MICFFAKLFTPVQNSFEFGASFDFGASNSSTVTVTRNLRGATTLLTLDIKTYLSCGADPDIAAI
jgi:hypothetical protein